MSKIYKSKTPNNNFHRKQWLDVKDRKEDVIVQKRYSKSSEKLYNMDKKEIKLNYPIKGRCMSCEVLTNETYCDICDSNNRISIESSLMRLLQRSSPNSILYEMIKILKTYGVEYQESRIYLLRMAKEVYTNKNNDLKFVKIKNKKNIKCKMQ